MTGVNKDTGTRRLGDTVKGEKGYGDTETRGHGEKPLRPIYHNYSFLFLYNVHTI